MKKTLAFLFLLISLSAQGQDNIQIENNFESLENVEFKDSLFNSEFSLQEDTVMLESAPKKTFGEKLGKFLGIDKSEELENLKKRIQTQRNLIDSLSVAISKPKIVVKTVPILNQEETKSIRKDENFVNSLPKSYHSIPKNDLAKLTKEIDEKISELIKQRESLIKNGGSAELITAKSNVIQSLEREKNVIKLSAESSELKTENVTLSGENNILKIEGDKLKKYLYTSFIVLFVLILIIAVILQRKKINVQDIEIEKQLKDINKKNTYLEHAAKIIRHDMHSGINTYMPRGLTSLEEKLKTEDIERLKLDSSLKMIKEGLTHTQKVYKSVYEFTNLVKQKVVFEKKMTDLKELIEKNLENTSYSKQVKVDDLVSIEVNDILFWNALENLIKNGLKYNSSHIKQVYIYMENGDLIVKDNGTGLSSERFNRIINQFINENDNSSSLGLNICAAILKEHGFDISCEELEKGTKITIKINKQI